MKNFRKSLSVFLLVLLVSSSAVADYGVRLGLGRNKGTISNAGGSIDSDTESKFLVGVFGEMSLLPALAIEFGANYFTLSSTSTYLTVPAVLKAKIDVGTVRPYFFVGPQVDFKLKDDSGTSKTMAFSLAFGGGAEFTIAPKLAILGEIRYVTSLSKIAETTAFSLPADVKYKSLQFITGLSFGL